MRFIIASFAGMAAVRGDDQVNCTHADYRSLAAMSGPVMAACMGGNETLLPDCFANSSVVYLSGVCYTNIVGDIGFLAPECEEWCGNEYSNTSAPCQNCLTFEFMRVADYAAPWEAPGACGADWFPLATANVTAGVECGGETRNNGSHCLANADGVSTRCGRCLERRHARVMTSCTPACNLNQTSHACTECVLYGDMAAMAYCMESGAAAASFLVGVAAFIAVAFAF